MYHILINFLILIRSQKLFYLCTYYLIHFNELKIFIFIQFLGYDRINFYHMNLFYNSDHPCHHHHHHHYHHHHHHHHLHHHNASQISF